MFRILIFQYDIHKSALKMQYYYPDLIELQNSPLTYSLWLDDSNYTPYLGDSGTIYKRTDCKTDGKIVKHIKIGQLSIDPKTPLRPKTILNKIPRVIDNWLNIPIEPLSLTGSISLTNNGTSPVYRPQAIPISKRPMIIIS